MLSDAFPTRPKAGGPSSIVGDCEPLQGATPTAFPERRTPGMVTILTKEAEMTAAERAAAEPDRLPELARHT